MSDRTETTILRPHHMDEPRRVMAAMTVYWSHVPRARHVAAIRRIRWAGTDWEGEGAFLTRCVRIALRATHVKRANVQIRYDAPDYLAATREVQGR